MRRAQASMEYMLTYGLAILIIAIIVGALFALGYFNSNLFAPRAQPGSCYVLRPLGAGTTTGASIQGLCNGPEPKFVAYGFNTNGQSFVFSNSLPDLSTTPQLTMTAWVDPSNTAGSLTMVSYGFVGSGLGSCPNIDDATLGQSGGQLTFTMGCGTISSNGLTLMPGVWNFVAVSATTVSSGVESVTFYVNNGMSTGTLTQSSFSSGPVIPSVPQLCIGCGVGSGSSPPSSGTFEGSVADVQIYNASLIPSDVSAIFFEGIQGAPIDIGSVQGWWPLNGDSRDYSGNGNDGAAYGIGFTESWTNGYTPP